MGTWSQPLFTTVSPGKPEEYSIILSELPEETVRIWKHAAFFGTEEKQSYTLSEFMNTRCDSHKIMDHMNNDQIRRWLSLFAYLAKKYPTLNTVLFHMYCSDEHKPYYFKWDRTKDGAEPLHINMHVGYPDSVHYFTLETDPESESGKKKPVFQKDLYEASWRKMPHDVYELRIRPTLF